MFLILVSIIGLAVAAYTDLKERIIYNELVAAMAIIGIGLQVIRSIVHADPNIIIAPCLTAGIVFICGFIFWKLEVWGGGDLKLFTALAILNPIETMIILFTMSTAMVVLDASITKITHKKIISETPFVPTMLAAYIILIILQVGRI